jgi:hypothetical protein
VSTVHWYCVKFCDSTVAWPAKFRETFRKIFSSHFIKFSNYFRKIFRETKFTKISRKFCLWRACNLTSFSPCLTGPVDYLFASRLKGPRFKSPGRVLRWNRDSPVSNVSLHWWPRRDWSSLQPRLWWALSQKLSLGPCADSVMIPLDLMQLVCPGFTLTAGPPSSFTTDRVGCWGGALRRACNLTSFSPCLTGPVDYLFASRHKGPRFKSPAGVLMWNRDSPVSDVSLHAYLLKLNSFRNLNFNSIFNDFVKEICCEGHFFRDFLSNNFC